MPTSLVIDDDPNLRRSLALILEREGHTVTTAGHPAEIQRHLENDAWDVVVLDLVMPELDGMAVLAAFRARLPDLPIVILTAHASLESAIEAVRQGARDYLVKPVVPSLLIARLREVLARPRPSYRRREIATQLQGLVEELHQLRRAPPPPVSTISNPGLDPCRFLQRGPLTIDLQTHQVLLGPRQVWLPTSTFAYLVTLMRHAPNPVSHETLVSESQGYQLLRFGARRITHRHMHELRRALESDAHHPQYIITSRDFGYRLAV